jgi:hypothetical protein
MDEPSAVADIPTDEVLGQTVFGGDKPHQNDHPEQQEQQRDHSC